MATVYKIRPARGFSLLEVLVAVVIISVGLLALASLQMNVIRASAQTKAQTLAASLAKDKIEEIRSFTTLDQYRLKTSASSPGTSETLNDSGGNQGGVNYTRYTLITRYVYNKGGGTPGFLAVGNTLTDAQITALNDATHTYVPGKDFKLVKVTVTWPDPNGGPVNSIALEDVLDSLDPSEGSNLVKSSLGGGGPRTLEQIISDPALDNMVIPIALGGGVDSAATNPKPTVIVGSNVVETRFDVLTYSGITNSGTATAQQKVETAMVGCTCTLTSPPASTVRGWRPTYWNGFRYATPTQVAAAGSESYSPPGKNDPGSSANQSAFCDQCCRDHYDPAGVKGATFSPRRVTKDSTDTVIAGSPSHTHHVDKLTAAPATATFKEACRLIRVDGFWRVAADIENDYFGVLATGDGTTAPSYGPDLTSVDATPPVTGATARYQNFVIGYMQGRFIPGSAPSAGTEQSTYNTVGTPVTLAASAAYELDKPASVTIDSQFNRVGSCSAITGITKANPAVVTHSATTTNCVSASAGVAIANGDKVTITGVTGMSKINNPGYVYTVANATATTFELQGVNTSVAAYAAYASGGLAEVTHGKWLHSRGLYVDYLEKEATDMITAARADSTCSVDAASLSLCILKLLPFTSINLTEISDWASATPSKVDVYNNNYASAPNGVNAPVRGEVGFISGANGETVNINTVSRQFNSGLLDLSYDAISPSDVTASFTSTQQFTISAPIVVPPKPGSGFFWVTWTGPAASPGTYTAPAAGFSKFITGGQIPKNCNAALPRFACNVDNPLVTAAPYFDPINAGLGLSPGNDNTMQVLVGGYGTTGTTTVTTSVPGCTGPFGPKVFTSVTSGPPSGRSDPASYSVNTCTTRSVVAALNSTTGIAASGTAPYTTTGTGQAQTTTISFPSINKDPNELDTNYIDLITVRFSSPGTVQTMTANPASGGTCTYTCAANNASNTNCLDVSKTKFVLTSAPCP